jgi:hypothetical protein
MGPPHNQLTVVGPNNFVDYFDPYFFLPDRTIAGVTRDSTGAPLGSCTVDLFRTADNVWQNRTVSDGSGNYSFTVEDGTQWYCRFYLTGSPDRAGTTVNTVQGA